MNYYVTVSQKRLLAYHVMRATITYGGIHYVEVSRHFSWKGAQKVANRLNAQEES